MKLFKVTKENYEVHIGNELVGFVVKVATGKWKVTDFRGTLVANGLDTKESAASFLR